MKPLTAKQMQQLDQWAIDKIGIPQIALMENAGKAVADQVTAISKPCKVCVIAYKGNNGGDGFVAARHLWNKGYDVTVWLLANPEQITGSAKINLDILKKLHIPQTLVLKCGVLEKALQSSRIVIDAIFGIGLKGEISGICAQAIDLINQYRSKAKYTVISVDVPSGIDATTGKVAKHSIMADYTVTFAAPKTGFFKYPAIKQIGRLIVADIGISIKDQRSKSKNQKTDTEYFLPKRLTWTHKGSYGKVLIVTGSRNMSGAAYLAAISALRIGAGLVYLAVPKSIQKLVAIKAREVITIPLAETDEGTVSEEAFSTISKIKADVLAVGPGLTTNRSTQKLVKQLITRYKTKYLVLDADGLNCIADQPQILKQAKAKVIITPHPGEMSRLTGIKVSKIQQNRSKIAQDFAKKFSVAVVLKGAYTIIANGKNVFVNSTGNPGMAKAGVGDVLLGMMAGFVAQGLTAQEAVYVHGLAGDLAAEAKTEQGVIAGDLVDEIPHALSRVS